MPVAEADMYEAIEAWQHAHGSRFGESTSGIERFEKFLIHLGYGSANVRFVEDEPIKAFLIDNPGVFEKIFEFIAENASGEQVSNLLSNGEVEIDGEGEEDEGDDE